MFVDKFSANKFFSFVASIRHNFGVALVLVWHQCGVGSESVLGQLGVSLGTLCGVRQLFGNCLGVALDPFRRSLEFTLCGFMMEQILLFWIVYSILK